MLALGESGFLNNDPPILTTVVVPSYNEEEGLPVVLQRIFAAIDERTEVLVVDDGSTDRTRAVASQFPCRVVWHSHNQGKGEAVRTGLRYARGENIVFIDADDTYPADLIPKMIALLEDHDMVVGSRSGGHANIPAFNRVGNAIFRNSIRYFYGFRPYDPLTGFFGIKRGLMADLALETQNFRIESEMAIKAASRGLRMADLPIDYGRRLGTAKLRGLQDGYTIFETIVRMLPRYSPAISLVLSGLIVGLVTVVAGAMLYGLEDWFLGSQAPEAFFVALLTALVGLQAASIGVLLVCHGAREGLLSHGNVVRALSAPLTSRLMLTSGLLVLVAAAAWALASGSEWRAAEDAATAFQNAQIALCGAVAGMQLMATGLLVEVLRAARPSSVAAVEVAASAVAASAAEAEDGLISE